MLHITRMRRVWKSDVKCLKTDVKSRHIKHHVSVCVLFKSYAENNWHCPIFKPPRGNLDLSKGEGKLKITGIVSRGCRLAGAKVGLLFTSRVSECARQENKQFS